MGPYRAELHTHCYRMLGSVHDAEDALQDALLRAWKGLPSFEGRSSVRSWLYTVVTNAALDLARRRPRSVLEPYPDRLLGDLLEPSPEAMHEQRESLELAFVVALQQLPPLQRAVLILREVMGFSAAEISGQLGTSVPSVTSALQRARVTVQARRPARSQQATLSALGDERTRAIAHRYADAIERGDADTLISMLTQDATWSMPPTPVWYQGHAALREWLLREPLQVRWRHQATRANGQLALGCYLPDPATGRFSPAVLDVLTLDGDRIAAVTAFLYHEAPREPPADAFARFGLPAELS